MSNEATGLPVVTGFEDLVAWQKSRILVRNIFELTEASPIAQRYGLRDQLQRAAVSVMSNVAEGFERGSRAEFHHMLLIAKGSCAEVRSLLVVALDAGFINVDRYTALNAQAQEVSRIIGGLRVSVSRQRDAGRPAR